MKALRTLDFSLDRFISDSDSLNGQRLQARLDHYKDRPSQRKNTKEVVMALVRWDPFRELEEVSDRLNRMFARPAVSRTNGKETMIVADWTPSVDISETEGEYQIKAEIPDVKKDDVKVTLEDGVLTIQGERKHEQEEKGKKFHRIERSYGSFVRTFSLPDVIDEGKVKAEFKDGVLNLHLPKSEKAKPKAIEVKVA
jgi:HSP20 family protein